MECCNCRHGSMMAATPSPQRIETQTLWITQNPGTAAAQNFFSIFPLCCVWIQTASPTLDNLLCGGLSSVNHLCCVCKLQVISVPLYVRVLILRCQHFGLDWLLKTISGCFAKNTICRWEICSAFPASVCLPGDLLCLTNGSSWLQDVQNIPFAHRSHSVYDPSATEPSFPQFFHSLRFYLLIILSNFKFNLLQIFQDSLSPYNIMIW